MFFEKSKYYFALTKPRVIELLLVATIPVMLLADRGEVNLKLILTTFFAGWLGAASANSMNMVIDADIDKKMNRTKNRPIASGQISTINGLIFSITLGVISFFIFYFLVNPLSAFLLLFTIFFYTVIYSLILKRNTSQNIIWGGIAGCMPALIGWSAVQNNIKMPAIIIFLIIFFWTPPHTWSLAIKYRDDYAEVDVPMLPVVQTEETVARRILIYSFFTVLMSLVLIKYLGILYLIGSILLGIWLMILSVRLLNEAKDNKKLNGIKYFLNTNIYLAVLFTFVALDSALNLNLIIS